MITRKDCFGGCKYPNIARGVIEEMNFVPFLVEVLWQL